MDLLFTPVSKARGFQFSGKIVGFALADAMGVPVEGYSRSRLEKAPVIGVRGYGSWHQPPGTWSDDTAMTLATMDSISKLGYIDLDDLMDKFVKWYANGDYTVDGLFDIGGTTRAAICNYMDGLSVTRCGYRNWESNGNGSLMRMMPIFRFLHSRNPGDWGDKEMGLIHLVSSLTHAHPISQISCGLYCLIGKELLNGVEKAEAVSNGLGKGLKYYTTMASYQYAQWLNHFSRLMRGGFSRLDKLEIQSGGFVLDSLESSIWVLLNTNTYKDLILEAINLGRDTDTTAAVTSGLGCLIYQWGDLPTEWTDRLRGKSKAEAIEATFEKVL